MVAPGVRGGGSTSVEEAGRALAGGSERGTEGGQHMRSYQIVEWGRPIELREYPTPTPQGTEVLLRVTAAGICHSDLHINDGYFDLGDGQRAELARLGARLPLT